MFHFKKLRIMKVYQVTVKTFYKYETKYYGKIEVQLTDCGTIPLTFSSKKKAEKKFYEIAKKHGVEEINIDLFPQKSFEYKWLGFREVVNLLEVDVY